VDNYLLIAMNKGLLQLAIDTYKGQKPAMEGIQLDKSTTGVGTISTPGFLDDAYKFVGRYASRSGSYSDLDVEHKIKPLFEVFKMNQEISVTLWEENFKTKGRVVVGMK
jgi:hypothetical protein